MTTFAVQMISVTIDAPFDRAYAFASQPGNFAQWASGLADTLHESDSGWVAATPQGEAIVEFSDPNGYGVLDHRVLLPGQPPIAIPLRMVPNGDGTELTLTLFRLPEMDDAAFDRDAATVRADLARLKALLEA